jgi:two-component system cell cycle sensor histidine kinase/response regulator CckA
MKSLKDLSIKYKVMSIMMLVSGVSLLLAGGILLLVETKSFKKRYITNLSTISEIIGANSTSALLFDDKEAARTTLSALAKQKTFTECGIYRPDEQLFARYVMHGHKREMPPNFRAPGTYYEGGKLIHFSSIIWKGETMGMVYICTDMAELQERVKQYSGITSTILIVALCAAVLLSLWLHRIVSSPVLQLTNVAYTIAAEQDYSIRVPISESHDELGILVRVFNQMLEQIQERDSALQNARDELEVKVEERAKEIREMSQMLKGIITNMPVVAFRINDKGVFTEAIGKGLQRLGLRPGEVVDQSAYNIYPDLATYMDNAKAGTMTFCEATGVHDGEHWCFSSYFFPDDDRPGHIVGFALDITDRKRAEGHEKILQDQLIRAERMRSLGVLAGGVAHDLNNILGSMLMLPELIKDDVQKEIGEDNKNLEESMKDLSTIESSARRASAIIKDLMTLGRRGKYQKVPMSLNDVTQKYTKSHEFVALKKQFPHIKITKRLSRKISFINASESHCIRVISNLVRNACEAIPESKGVVRMQTSNITLKESLIGYETIPAGKYVLFSVSDNGAGIAIRHLEKIFEPFFTKKKMTGRSGSGLGLSVVHGVVKDHDGYLNVTSVPDKGTNFQLYFPTTEATAEGEKELVKEALRGGTESILVVDDEYSQRQLAKRSLKTMGYTVTTAENGHDALEKIGDVKNEISSFDLVILDMIMEDDFDGLTTYEHILAKCPGQKVIIASGYAPTKRSQAAVDLGAVWLAKPYDNSELAAAVRSKLDKTV